VTATRLLGGWLMVLALLVAVGAGCKRSEAAPAKVETPVVKDDTDTLLLTWIDDKGDFHVETAASAVPMMGRDAVRVQNPGNDSSLPPDQVFVTDMRSPGADGAYPVRTMTRADFEALAVARRQKTGPTLASAAPPPPSAASDTSEAAAPAPPAHAPVIIYGASWCGACHQAEAYLKRKGIPYVEKDVEKDPAAAREMQAKLDKNGLHGGSIPVIDVGGKVMVGFNAQEIDGALGQAL
jgi:glutaredoxin